MSSDIKEMLQGEPNKGVRKKDKGGEEDMPLCDLGEAYRAEFRLVLQGALCLCVWWGEVDTIPSQGSLTQDSLVKDQKQGHINSQILSTFYSCGQSGLM